MLTERLKEMARGNETHIKRVVYLLQRAADQEDWERVQGLAEGLVRLGAERLVITELRRLMEQE